jgi:hypothetical protein
MARGAHDCRSLADPRSAGLLGIGISFVIYADELLLPCNEVRRRLERLGVRETGISDQ